MTSCSGRSALQLAWSLALDSNDGVALILLATIDGNHSRALPGLLWLHCRSQDCLLQNVACCVRFQFSGLGWRSGFAAQSIADLVQQTLLADAVAVPLPPPLLLVCHRRLAQLVELLAELLDGPAVRVALLVLVASLSAGEIPPTALADTAILPLWLRFLRLPRKLRL